MLMFLRVKGARRGMNGPQCSIEMHRQQHLASQVTHLSFIVREVTAGVIATLEVRVICFPVSSLYVSYVSLSYVVRCYSYSAHVGKARPPRRARDLPRDQ